MTHEKITKSSLDDFNHTRGRTAYGCCIRIPTSIRNYRQDSRNPDFYVPDGWFGRKREGGVKL